MTKERSKRAKEQPPVGDIDSYSLWTVPYEVWKVNSKVVEEMFAGLDLDALSKQKMPERSEETKRRLRQFDSRVTEKTLLRRIP